MTEKNYNPEQRNKKAMKNQRAVAKTDIPASKSKAEEKSENKIKIEEKKTEKTETKTEEKKESKGEKKKPEVKKVRKDFAIVNGRSLPISTKKAAAICKFIKKKEIKKAIADLERVKMQKLAVPMKGEIPHQKGNIMSGGYPVKTSEQFIKLLKSLQANANLNEVENPIIVEAVANIASRPFGRFGRVRRKRTHVKIKAMGRGKK